MACRVWPSLLSCAALTLSNSSWSPLQRQLARAPTPARVGGSFGTAWPCWGKDLGRQGALGRCALLYQTNANGRASGKEGVGA